VRPYTSDKTFQKGFVVLKFASLTKTDNFFTVHTHSKSYKLRGRHEAATVDWITSISECITRINSEDDDNNGKKDTTLSHASLWQNDRSSFYYTKSIYGRLSLEVDGQIVKLPFSKGPWLIGRSRACDVCLAGDEHVSRNHCKLEIVRNVPVLSDLGSTDGTFLNDDVSTPIVQEPLKPGDKILVGNSTIIFRVKDGSSIFTTDKSRSKCLINEGDDTDEEVSELEVEDGFSKSADNNAPPVPQNWCAPM